MAELYPAEWLAAPHKTATLRAVTEHFRHQLPSGTILGKPCRKHGHTWNGTPWCIRKHGHCAVCCPIQHLLDPDERRQRRIEAKREARRRLAKQGLTSRGTLRKPRLEPLSAYRQAIRRAGSPSVADLVAAEQRAYWREYPSAYYAHRLELDKWRYFVDPWFRSRKLERKRKYREANRERYREQARNWYYANRDAVLARARLRPSRPMTEASRIRLRRWREANPDYERMKRRAREHRRRALMANAKGLVRIAGKDIQQRFDHFNSKCAYCNADCSPTVDHFIPIARGGRHVLSNLLPACYSCNSHKTDRDPEAWYRSQPFFTEQRWRRILTVLGKTRAPVGQLALL